MKRKNHGKATAYHGTHAKVKVLWQFYLFALDLYHVAILSHCLKICCLKYLKISQVSQLGNFVVSLEKDVRIDLA